MRPPRGSRCRSRNGAPSVDVTSTRRRPGRRSCAAREIASSTVVAGSAGQSTRRRSSRRWRASRTPSRWPPAWIPKASAWSWTRRRRRAARTRPRPLIGSRSGRARTTRPCTSGAWVTHRSFECGFEDAVADAALIAGVRARDGRDPATVRLRDVGSDRTTILTEEDHSLRRRDSPHRGGRGQARRRARSAVRPNAPEPRCRALSPPAARRRSPAEGHPAGSAEKSRGPAPGAGGAGRGTAGHARLGR